MSRLTRALALATCTVLATGTAAVAAPAPSSSSSVQRLPGTHRVLFQGAIRPSGRATAGTSSTAKLAQFTGSINDGGTTFSYTMVGTKPTTAQTTQSTTVTTVVVPLKIKLSNGHVYNPGTGNGCDSTAATTRVANSPVLKTASWSFGGKTFSSQQYVDAFQRAEFYKYTKSTGINPNYHVKLAPTTHSTITVSPPGADTAEGSSSCGTEGAIEIGWFDNYVQTTLIPNLTAAGAISPSKFPLFLVNDVIFYEGTTANCCILGYHNAMSTSHSSQTYGVADYESSDFFGTSVADVSALSHEVGEWVNDPFVDNATKPWGHTGQVSGCQNNLEVGDPLSGSLISKSLNGFTYHVQEMAFFSWFFHQSPSIGVSGLYSNKGSFTTPAAACA